MSWHNTREEAKSKRAAREEEEQEAESSHTHTRTNKHSRHTFHTLHTLDKTLTKTMLKIVNAVQQHPDLIKIIAPAISESVAKL